MRVGTNGLKTTSKYFFCTVCIMVDLRLTSVYYLVSICSQYIFNDVRDVGVL
jgi:hypothetical protein